MWSLIGEIMKDGYRAFVSVTHPVFGVSCAVVLLGIAGIKFAIWFLQTFIGGSPGVSNSDTSENHTIVRRK